MSKGEVLNVGRLLELQVQVVGVDGGGVAVCDVLVDPVSAATAYAKVRSLANTRMGKAYHYEVLEACDEDRRQYRRTGKSVLIKTYLKECVARSVDTAGRPSGERPFREASVAQHLASCGGSNFQNGDEGADGGAGAERDETEPMSGVEVDGSNLIPEFFGFYEAAASYMAIMEFIPGGELFTVLQARGALGETTARSLFTQMVRATRFLHRSGCAHLDISVENLVVTEDADTVKLIDFGLARKVDQLPRWAGKPGLLNHWCGKPGYAAPEMYVRDVPWEPTKCDVWSLGVCLFIMLFGGPPFAEALHTDRVFSAMCRHKQGIKGIVDHWRGQGVALPDVSAAGIDVLRSMLDPEPARRPSLDTVLLHPWLQ